MIEVAVPRRAVRAADHLQTGGVDGDGEGHGVVAVGLGHVARRQHDHLVGIGHHRGVDFGAAHHDAVRPFVDDTHVVIGMNLLRRRPAAVALHVGLGHGDGQVLGGAVAVKRLHARQVIGLEAVVHVPRHHVQGEEGIGADLLDQHHQGAAQGGSGLDELAALEQVVAVAGQMVVAADGFADVVVVDDGEGRGVSGPPPSRSRCRRA